MGKKLETKQVGISQFIRMTSFNIWANQNFEVLRELV